MRHRLAISIGLTVILLAPASANVWSMHDASTALECSVLFERFETDEAGSEPFDFSAAAEDIRERVRNYHGTSFTERVFQNHQSFWDSEAAWSPENVNRLRSLLYECRKLAFVWGYAEN